MIIRQMGLFFSNNDKFGGSVANIGDLNNDGVNDLAVGEYVDWTSSIDNRRDNEGAIYILFLNSDGSVDSTVEVNSSTTNGPSLTTSDRFGAGVAGVGDLDGDGVEDIVVGAPLDDAGGSNRGTVHILFMNSDGSVKSTAEINDNTTNGPVLSDGNRFGESVADIGDLDGDGINDLAVGARNDHAIHVIFMNSDGSVKSTVKIDANTENGPNNSDYLGSGVAGINDLNGDGVNDILVGADHGDMEEQTLEWHILSSWIIQLNQMN